MNLKESIARMRADIRSAYKSEDTEEWWDRVFTKPLGYLWARFFIRMGWTPNMVTILDMFIGFAGGCLLVSESFALNLIGVLLIIWANIYDSTDGQMARLTGMKSMLGRILDAISTFVWYIAIYPALCIRLSSHNIPFTNTPWGGAIWVVAVICALCAHMPQCMMADYYRNIHLFFLKNKNGDEHDSSANVLAQRAALPKNAYFRRLYMTIYALYTRMQEAVTPNTQKLFRAFEKDGVSEEVREDYLNRSRKYIQLTNILTFNTRAYSMFICVLCGVPVLSFAFELFVMDALLVYMIIKYEQIARDVLYGHSLPGSEVPYKKPNFWPVLFFVLGLIGAIIALACTDLSLVNWHGVVLGKMYIWLPAILGIWLVIYALHTLTYAIIIGPDAKKIKPLRLFKMVICGYAMNSVSHVGFMGGDPYRIMELNKHSIPSDKAAAVSFSFSHINGAGTKALWFIGALLFLFTGCKGGFLSGLVAVLILAIAGYLSFQFVRSKEQSYVEDTLKLFSRLPLVGKRLGKLRADKHEQIESIDREMAAFKARQRDFAITLFIETVTKLLEAAEIYLLLRVLGANVTYLYAVASLAAASLIGSLIFFIPMQIGTREAVYAMVLRWTGVVSSVAVTASLLTRVRQLIFLVIGVGMLLLKDGDENK